MDEKALERILPRVAKPARYLGNEWNSIHKDTAAAAVRVALAFPDLYEVGMSHLGLAILYDILNSRPDTWAERVYAPAPDMERELRAAGLPLFSLESRTPLADFDLVGFTLPYELTATNILTVLDLGGVPLLARDRGDDSPIVIAGGVGAMNPEPLADFIDAFVIGDGEEVVHEIADAVAGEPARTRRMERLGRISGVYVPARYEVSYADDGTVGAVTPRGPDAPAAVTRRIVADLDAVPYPVAPVVPHLAPVHDRFTLEIMRGCPRRCRFCQARAAYAPPRRRSIEKLVALAEEGIARTGYDEVSLLALSAGDYPRLGDLVQQLSERLRDRRVRVSLPSLYADTMREHLKQIEPLEGSGAVRGGGFTFAPETGSARMREVIGKHIDDDVLVETVHALFRAGHRQVKLYLMVGLPGETEDDLAASLRLVRRLLEGGGRRGLNVSVSSFVPKPGTPFEREPMASRETLLARQQFMKKGLRDRRIRYRWHDVDTSFLEAVFARGDRRLGEVILGAWRKGARLDAWTEHFRRDAWMEAFRECGVDPDFYAARRRGPGERLPWEHIGAAPQSDTTQESDSSAPPVS